MKKIFYSVVLLGAMTACGGKENSADSTLTPAEESQLVDSMSQHLKEHTLDMKQKTDSVNAEVDSLLEGI